MATRLISHSKTFTKRMMSRTPGLRRLVALWDRMAILEQSLAVLRSSLQTRIMQQDTRIERLQNNPHEAPAASASTAGIEFLLAHARLPAPPGRILDADGMLANQVIDLASLGYEIGRNASARPQWDAVLCRLNEPSARESRVSDSLNLLGNGGRLILSMPLAAGEPTPRWLTTLPVRETVRAHHDSNHWAFTRPDDATRASLVMSVVEKA